MSNFQRSRSKVWWGDSPPDIGSPVAAASRQDDWAPQLPHWVGPDLPMDTSASPELPIQWLHRRSSPSSHKSQDSGFSDSDSSPPNSHHENGEPEPEPKNEEPLSLSSEKTPRTFSSKHNSKVIDATIEKVSVTPEMNINAGNVSVDKCTPKKTFAESQSKDDTETSINDNMELIKMSDNVQVAVNNQPRVRSPVANVYQSDAFAGFKKIHFELDSHDRIAGKICTEKYFFQRSKFHKSLDIEIRKNREEKENNRSIGYIPTSKDTEEVAEPIGSIEEVKEDGEETESKFTPQHLTDTLHLKNAKKNQRKTRSKLKNNLLSLITKKNHLKFAEEYDGRVPTLGLPRSQDSSGWVVVGYPSEERLVEGYSERLVSSYSDKRMKEKRKIDQTTSPASKSSPQRKITPPPEFQDGSKNSNSKPKPKLKPLFHRSKSTNDMETDLFPASDLGSLERLSTFDLQIDVNNASTPKVGTSRKMSDTNTPHNVTKLKPVNLMKDFDMTATSADKSSTHPNNLKPIKALQKISSNQPGSVQQWLGEMVNVYEPECMLTLQSKTISAEVKARVSASSATITGNIRKVQTHGQIVVYLFYEVMRELEMSGNYIVRSSDAITSLMGNMSEFVLTHSATLKTKPHGETPERWNKITRTLAANIQKIIDISEDVKLELNESQPAKDVILKNLDDLLDIFIETAKAVLIQQLKTLVSIIEEPPSDIIIKSTLTSINHLGVILVPESGSKLTDLCGVKLKEITELPFVECGVPRALLTAIIETNKSSIKALSLRALATICVTGDAVEQFAEGGGIEILSDILGVESNPEPQMREAVTVLTQVTAPWLKGRYDITQLDIYLDNIVKSITAIMVKTKCCQLLLLCTACLVNLLRLLLHLDSPSLTNMSYNYKNDIIQTIIKHGTVEKLLEAVKNRGPQVSIFLQEQTANFLSILSQIEACTKDLASVPSVSVALFCFLQPMRGTPIKPNEMQAEFRLVNKVTDALARLCICPEISAQVVMLGGIQRLVRLVKSQQKYQGKKSSDQVLINCLRTLRIINRNDPAAMASAVDANDMKTMLEPSLMESVLLYSAKQESYV